MKDRPQSISDSPYSLADLDSFHDDLSYLVYELMFKDAFKHQYDVFKKNFKLDLNSFDNLNEIVKKWGDAEIPLSVINKTLKKDIERCINNGKLQLPAEQAKADQLVKPLGYYFHIQLRLAQLKYHIFTYANNAAQNSTFHREQGIMAARKLNKLLLKAISFTTDVTTSKHSFTLWGISLTHPSSYNQDAVKLKEIHDGFNHKCKKLLKFVNTLTSAYLPYELKGGYQAATIFAKAMKLPSFKKAKRRVLSIEEIVLDKNDMQPKQGVNPIVFPQENNQLSLHPAWEIALGLSLETGENLNQVKKHLTGVHDAIKKTNPGTTHKTTMTHNIKHESFTPAANKSKQRSFFQSLRAIFNILVKAIINAFSPIIGKMGGDSEKINAYLHSLAGSAETTKANPSSDTRHITNYLTKEEGPLPSKHKQTMITTHEVRTPLEKGKHTAPKDAKNISKEAPRPSTRRFKQHY